MLNVIVKQHEKCVKVGQANKWTSNVLICEQDFQ